MQERINHLRNEIRRHSDLYYKQHAPVISDAQYDAIFAKLVELETEYPEYADPNSPTAAVGSDITNRFRKASHPLPMLSIKSCFTTEEAQIEMLSFLSQQPTASSQQQFFITPKYDGIAIELHYNTIGELTLALTRGNGNQGTDVTANIRTIKAIPKQLFYMSDGFIVRGEIYLTHTEFNRLNKLRKKTGIEPYNNIRSAAASLVKAKHSSETAIANLSASFFFYCGTNVPNVPSVPNQFSTLTTLGFNTPPLQTAATITEATTIANQIARAGNCPTSSSKGDERSGGGFPTDGAVIKTEFVHCKTNTRYQVGAWAIKTNSPVWETTLRFVSWNVSGKGKLTPIAHYVPFTEGGSLFAKANLYNIENITALNLTHGATIHVQVSGGIIPEVILSSIKHQASPSDRIVRAGSIQHPSHCPACHSKLETRNSKLVCTNTTWCPAFGHTAETVVKNTGSKYQVHFEIPASPLDGPGIYREACMQQNAIIARLKENKHRYVLLADNLQTVANIGVQVGKWLPGEHTFERQSHEELLADVNKLLADSNKLSMY